MYTSICLQDFDDFVGILADILKQTLRKKREHRWNNMDVSLKIIFYDYF